MMIQKYYESLSTLFMPLVSLYIHTSSEHEKSFGLLIFSGGVERN